jgi:hypothetical protein
LLLSRLALGAAVPDQYNFSQGMYRFSDIIDNVLESAQEMVLKIARSVLSATITVMGAVYAPMVVLGVLLYTTKINRYRGKDLIYGALLLAFFSEFVLPTLLS